MTDNLEEYPIIDLGESSKGWADAYELGTKLMKIFPDQDADDFAYAVGYHLYDEFKDAEIRSLKMCHEGYNDGDDWIWYVQIKGKGHFFVVGGCDYSGWDCQSWAKAVKVADVYDRGY